MVKARSRDFGAMLFTAGSAIGAFAASPAPPQTVHFTAADGRTELVAYLFAPEGAGRHSAVIMLHGRSGPYGANVNTDCKQVSPGQESPCNATTLSKRHAMWGAYWVQHGYAALLVDSFGPRGRAHGYGRHTHEAADRIAVNERTVRPLDAEAALAWLAARPDVHADRVMLQGWSNGASTALNAMHRQAQTPTSSAAGALRFRAALVLYPACGPRALISQRYTANAEVWAFLGGNDDEVSPTVCASVLDKARGGPVAVTLYPGATHGFDDPGAARQAVAANRTAKADAMARAAALFDALP